MNQKELEKLKKRGQRVQKRLRKKKLREESENQALKITLPDPSCHVSLKAWFNVYGFLAIHELARLAGKSTSTIKKWQQKAGLSCGEPITSPECEPRELEAVSEEVWNCRSWFEENYTRKRFGTSAVARMIGRDVKTVRRKLKYYDIPIRSHDEAVRSSNPCCTERWLTEYYYDQGLSLRECATKAGVVPSTITNWLCKFNMDPRDTAEANHVRSKKWPR